MTIYIDILKHLADNDNGQFIDITSLHDDFSFLNAKTKELQKAGRIEIKSPGVYYIGHSEGTTTIGDTSELKKIKAKILLAGHEYLKQTQTQSNANKGFSGNVIGDNFSGNTIIIGDKNQANTKSETNNSNTTNINPTNKSGLLELFYKWWWAIAVPILVGLILLAIEYKIFQ